MDKLLDKEVSKIKNKRGYYNTPIENKQGEDLI
jgi:hypothetical protein